MPYIQRDEAGNINGLFANPQEFASEYLSDNDPIVELFLAKADTNNAKRERDTLLSGTDWLAIRHRDQKDAGEATTLTDAQFASLLGYRQALRDWPSSASFPNTFPTPPELS